MLLTKQHDEMSLAAALDFFRSRGISHVGCPVFVYVGFFLFYLHYLVIVLELLIKSHHLHLQEEFYQLTPSNKCGLSSVSSYF